MVRKTREITPIESNYSREKSERGTSDRYMVRTKLASKDMVLPKTRSGSGDTGTKPDFWRAYRSMVPLSANMQIVLKVTTGREDIFSKPSGWNLSEGLCTWAASSILSSLRSILEDEFS
jgi:hypothetical protein